MYLIGKLQTGFVTLLVLCCLCLVFLTELNAYAEPAQNASTQEATGKFLNPADQIFVSNRASDEEIPFPERSPIDHSLAPHWLGAGPNLRKAAMLRYWSTGLGLAATAAPLFGDSDSADQAAIALSIASIGVGLFAPHYIGEAGEELGWAGPALKKYRSSFYGGLKWTLLGVGATVGGVRINVPVVAFGGLLVTAGAGLYTGLVPPYYIGSAGNHLRPLDGLSPEMNRKIDQAGSHLRRSCLFTYTSIAASVVGGVLLAAGIEEENNSTIALGVAAGIVGTGLGVLSSVEIDLAGRRLEEIRSVPRPRP